jgi:acyl-coenzyme A thioesterase PaaI-like protein
MPWPEPGWTPIEPFPFAEAGRPFTGIARNKDVLSLRYFRKPDGQVVAIAHFGPGAMGAPGQAHGGAILTALDEALGAAAWAAGYKVLTARLTTDFRRSVPVGSELLAETRLLRARHRLVFVEGSLIGPDGTVYATAEGRFMELEEEHQKRLFGPRGARLAES